MNIMYDKRCIFYYSKTYYVVIMSMHLRCHIEYIQKSFIMKEIFM